MNLGGVVHLNKPGIVLVLLVFVLFFFYLFSNTTETAKEDLKSSIELKDVLAIAIKAAQNGGTEILKAKDHMQITSKGKTKEGIDNPVTSADYNSHCAMKATLHHKFPDLLVISEEAKTQCDGTIHTDYSESRNVDINAIQLPNLYKIDDLTVWIDPLDATKEFTEQLYTYVTTMVCVAIKGEPIIGVIHKPFENKTYWAWVGQNNGNNLEIGSKQQHDRPKILISRSHSGLIMDSLSKSFNKNVEIISAAGAGYKVLEVVAGKADAYVHSTAIKKWDICAGNAILNAVGGKMTTKDNKIIHYFDDGHQVNDNGLVATMNNHDKYINTF